MPKRGENALQEENVHEMTSERGENALQEKNVHEMAPKCGENAPQEKNVPGNTHKPGETAAAEGKCPGKHPQTRRNRRRRAQREHRCNKKRHPSREGVFYLNGSGELTAEVVEQNVL